MAWMLAHEAKRRPLQLGVDLRVADGGMVFHATIPVACRDVEIYPWSAWVELPSISGRVDMSRILPLEVNGVSLCRLED